jgi:uncharacterized membrane protein YukC
MWPKMANKEKPAHISRKKLTIAATIVGAFLIVGLLCLTWVKYFYHPNCQGLITESTSALRQQDYKSSYKTLNKYGDYCLAGERLTSPAKLEYSFRLAVSAYQTGHTKEAQHYSIVALNVIDSLHANKTKISDEDLIILDLTSIRFNEKYTEMREFK